jgi:hypothetical protein
MPQHHILVCVSHPRVELQWEEERSAVWSQPFGVFNGGEADQDVIDQSLFLFPRPLLVNHHLRQAMAAGVWISDGEPNSERDGNRINRPSHQLKDFSRLKCISNMAHVSKRLVLAYPNNQRTGLKKLNSIPDLLRE